MAHFIILLFINKAKSRIAAKLKESCSFNREDAKTLWFAKRTFKHHRILAFLRGLASSRLNQKREGYLIVLVVLNLDGAYLYFCPKAAEKYSRLLNPEEKQTSVTGSFVFFNNISACFNRRFSKYWCGEQEVKVLNIRLKWKALIQQWSAISFNEISSIKWSAK